MRVAEGLNLWGQEVAETCGLHGFSWFARCRQPVIKTLLGVLIIVTLIGLPITVIIQTLDFYHSESFSTHIEWTRAENLTYPNITVCQPLYFDKSKMEEYNVSDALAAYMTTVLDIGYSTLYKEMESDKLLGPRYLSNVTDLEKQTLDLLSRHNMDLLQLFKALAIRCEDFLHFCEIHRRMYTTPRDASNELPSCCGKVFDSAPFFTYEGTCYTTKMEIREFLPSSISSIRVWLINNKTNTPVFPVPLRGSDGTERHGAVWAISRGDDAPAAVLPRGSTRISPGMLTVVKLAMQRVVRTQLSSPCLSYNPDFYTRFGMNLTQLNCEMANVEGFVPGCSIMPYVGLGRSRFLPPCAPVNYSNVQSAKEFLAKKNFSRTCHQNCDEVIDTATTSTSVLNWGSVEAYKEDLLAPEYHPESVRFSVLQFHFATFLYSTSELQEQTIMDFLSQLGGWMGLAIGASVFSFFEIAYYLAALPGFVCAPRTKARE